MAVILWILGVLLALIVLLCVTRVGVHAVFGETLLLDAKIGWFHIHILPAKEANKKREKKAEDAEETTEKAAKKPTFPKPSFSDIRDAVSALWPPLKRALDRTRRGLRIAPLDLSVTLGGLEDPASAAQLYGELNAAGSWCYHRFPGAEMVPSVQEKERKTTAGAKVGTGCSLRKDE